MDVDQNEATRVPDPRNVVAVFSYVPFHPPTPRTLRTAPVDGAAPAFRVARRRQRYPTTAPHAGLRVCSRKASRKIHGNRALGTRATMPPSASKPISGAVP